MLQKAKDWREECREVGGSEEGRPGKPHRLKHPSNWLFILKTRAKLPQDRAAVHCRHALFSKPSHSPGGEY